MPEGCIIGLSTAVLVVQKISRNKSLSSCTLYWSNVLPRCVMILVSVFLWSCIKSARLTQIMLTSCHPRGMPISVVFFCLRWVACCCQCQFICPRYIDMWFLSWSGCCNACKFSLSSLMFLTTSCNICTCFWTGGLQIWEEIHPRLKKSISSKLKPSHPLLQVHCTSVVFHELHESIKQHSWGSFDEMWSRESFEIVHTVIWVSQQLSVQ